MRKLILFNLISLDGYFEGPGGSIDWHTVDEEFNDFATAQLDEAGGLVFGRVTYSMMAAYWPTPEAAASDPEVAERMNALPKIVASRTLKQADWANSRVVQDIAAELRRSKGEPGGDLLLFGSGLLVADLARQGLIDEYRLMISPVVLGAGRALFEGLPEPLPLELLRTRQFGNGNVLLVYRPRI
jgi:dihydrofolate reductase